MVAPINRRTKKNGMTTKGRKDWTFSKKNTKSKSNQ